MSNELKILYKDVRNDIKLGNNIEAIKKCEDLLKNDPNSYEANLLLGAAYQNINKAEATKFLRKAVECSAGNPPTAALLGLLSCAPINEQPIICERLLTIAPDKYADFYARLYHIALNPLATANSLEIFKLENKKSKGEKKRLAQTYMARAWISTNFNISSEDEIMFFTALLEIVNDSKLPEHLTANKRYLKHLFKENKLVDCLRRADKIVERYPTDIYAYEWICKIYGENWATSLREELKICLSEPLEFYATKLLQLDDKSYLALIINAIKLYERQDYYGARELIYRIQKLQMNNSMVTYLLALVYIKMSAFELASILLEGLGLINEKDYAICLSYETQPKLLQQAINLLKTWELDDEVLTALARCYSKLGRTTDMENLDLDDLAKAEFTMTTGEAIDYLRTINTNADKFGYSFLIAKLLIKVENYAEALRCLLDVSRMKPYYAECFLYLGKIYLAYKDPIRVKKCLEKCVHLNPVCMEAVDILSAIYQEAEEEDANAALLLTTLKHSRPENSTRMHYRLGLHYLNINKWDESIYSFRAALQPDQECVLYWEALADAYAARGSYNSAIRVCQKILLLDADNVYAKLRKAIIKTTIRMYCEAIEDFDNLLLEHPDYLPALRGIAEAHIGMANNYKTDNCFGKCKDHLQLAVDHLQRVFLKSENLEMLWIWRLTANVFLQVAQLPNSLANLDVTGQLAKRGTENVFLNRKDLFNLAIRFYTCALKIQQSTYIWYELSICYYYCARYSTDDSKIHIEMAMKTCQIAIKEQRNRWQNWNLLGVIFMHDEIQNYAYAQHCFVQALLIERKSYSTWANLGILYLTKGDITLANLALQRAQQASPIHPNAWIGQACIADQINEQDEALDLFRHCQQFGYHSEAALGYAHWVCRLIICPDKTDKLHFLHAMESMYADTVALDCINLYIRNEEDEASAAAYSLQGFLCARKKLYNLAIIAYEKAAKKASNAIDRDKMYTSLGFMYLKVEKPQKALFAFNNVQNTSFAPIVGLAASYTMAGQYEEAYSVYTSVLATSENDDDKAARILLAMTPLVYASEGPDDTKTILYQCLSLKNAPIEALYAICAVDILNKSYESAKTIFTELKVYENEEKYIPDITFLTTQLHQACGEVDQGFQNLLSRVHIYPNNFELRKMLCHYMLDNFPQRNAYFSSTSIMALSVLKLQHQDKNKKIDPVEDAKTLMMASYALQKIDRRRSLKLIQRAVHLNPRNQVAWSELLDSY